MIFAILSVVECDCVELIVQSKNARKARCGGRLEECRSGSVTEGPADSPLCVEALAWRIADDGNDARRDSGIAERQERRLDGEGQR